MHYTIYLAYVGAVVRPSGSVVAFRERSFSALESSGQLTVIISLLEDAGNVFNLSVIPIAKYPLEAEGTIMHVWCLEHLLITDNKMLVTLKIVGQSIMTNCMVYSLLCIQ